MDLIEQVWVSPLIAVIKFFAVLFLYLGPILIATSRHHHNALPIAIINIVFGWTILGWFIALIWACTSPPPVAEVVIRRSRDEEVERIPDESDDPPDR